MADQSSLLTQLDSFSKTGASTTAFHQSPSRIATAERKWESKLSSDSSSTTPRPMVTLIQTLSSGPCYNTETLLIVTPNCPLPCASLATQSEISSPFSQEITGPTAHGATHLKQGNPPYATATCKTGNDGPKEQNDCHPSELETTSASRTKSDPLP